eukprot:2951244-Rhodomonas_salina.1
MTHKDPEIEERIKKETKKGENQENSKNKKKEESQLDKVPVDPSFEGIREILFEYLDVFPADLPTEVPPEREFNMKIPIKPGSIPPNKAPYRISEDAKE